MVQNSLTLLNGATSAWRRLIILLFLVSPSLLDAQDLPPEWQQWTAEASNPVFVGEEGHWDAWIRERGWILKEGDIWKLWYTGYDSPEKTMMKLGYATSVDGIHWKRSERNPIYDDHWVEDMMIVRHSGTYYMFAEGAQDQAQLLTSADGMTWQRVGTLDVRLVNGQPIPPGPFGTPTAILKDGVWHLFYERQDAGVWLATSSDMKTWTNVADEPLIVPGPEPFDRLMIAMNQIVEHHGRYYAVMHGTGSEEKPRDWCTWFAVSDDLRTWKKCDPGPVIPIRENRSSGVLVEDGGDFRLYTMHGRVDLYRPSLLSAGASEK
ncbi:MAG: glycosylase [Planctomycetaceae bacterium]